MSYQKPLWEAFSVWSWAETLSLTWTLSSRQVCACREGAEGVHPPEAGRRHHPAAGRQAVRGLPALGECPRAPLRHRWAERRLNASEAARARALAWAPGLLRPQLPPQGLQGIGKLQCFFFMGVCFRGGNGERELERLLRRVLFASHVGLESAGPAAAPS